jgi:TonB-dependent starch-binding outer membrane protein SusC
MGLQSSMTFGSFDFTMMFRGLYGQDVWSLVNTNYAVLSDRFPSNNVLKSALDYNITSATRIGSMFIEKGSFTKLPKAGVLKGARIYFTGQNLITITKYSGMDPENVDLGGLTPGIDARSFYPATRTFIAGLNFNF